MDELTETRDEAELPEDLKAMLAKIRRRSRKRVRDILLIFPVTMSLFFLEMILMGSPYNYFTLFLLTLLPIAVEIILIFKIFSREKKGIYGFDEREIERIAATEGKRIIGVVLDHSKYSMPKGYSPQRLALMQKLLSRLTPEDANLLTQKQKNLLVSVIRPMGKGITFAALGALTQIGDSNTLRSLKRWRISQAALYVQPEVKEAMEQCIAVIEARLAANRSDSQLLRPSSASDQPDTLLRPVAHTPDENAETLLRADLTPRSQGAQQFENRAQQATPLRTSASLGGEGENDEETSDDIVTERKP